MFDTLSESPVSTTWKGKIYSGAYRAEDGRLYVDSVYGSKNVQLSKSKARAGLKEAARDVLTEIVKGRELTSPSVSARARTSARDERLSSAASGGSDPNLRRRE